MENKSRVLGGLKRVARALISAVAKLIMVVVALPAIGLGLVAMTVFILLSEIWKALSGHGDSIDGDDRPFVIDVKVRRASSDDKGRFNITTEK